MPNLNPFFPWIWPALRTAWREEKTQLELDDLPPLPQRDAPSTQKVALLPGETFLQCMFKRERKSFAIAFFFCTIWAYGQFMIPLIFHAFVLTLECDLTDAEKMAKRLLLPSNLEFCHKIRNGELGGVVPGGGGWGFEYLKELWMYPVLLWLTMAVAGTCIGLQHHVQTNIGQRVRQLMIQLIFTHVLEAGRADDGAEQEGKGSSSSSDKKEAETTCEDPLNLISSDAQKWLDAAPTYLEGWASPLIVIVCFLFIIKLVGPPAALMYFLFMGAAGPLSVFWSIRQAKVREERIELTDKRLKLCDELLQGIRIVKYFAWEKSYIEKIEGVRRQELELLKWENRYFAFSAVQTVMMPVLANTSCLLYLSLSGGGNSSKLSTSTAFTLMVYGTMLRFPMQNFGFMVTQLLQLKLVVRRLEAFLGVNAAGSSGTTGARGAPDGGGPPGDEDKGTFSSQKRSGSGRGSPKNDFEDDGGAGGAPGAGETPSSKFTLRRSGEAVVVFSNATVAWRKKEDAGEDPPRPSKSGPGPGRPSVHGRPSIRGSLLTSEYALDEVRAGQDGTGQEGCMGAVHPSWPHLTAGQLATLSPSPTPTKGTIKTTPTKGKNDVAPIDDKFIDVELGGGSSNEDLNVVLHDLNLEFRRGEVYLAMGRIGSGKSTLLASILGEAKIVNGNIVGRHGAGATTNQQKSACQEQLRYSYTSQTAWIRNCSIKDNILFFRSFDAVKYERALGLASLHADLEQFAHGEDTQIGERGLTLSGGQKMRVALARGLYELEDTDVFLFDDIFAALDGGTAREVAAKLLKAQMEHHVFVFTGNKNFLYSAAAGEGGGLSRAASRRGVSVSAASSRSVVLRRALEGAVQNIPPRSSEEEVFSDRDSTDSEGDLEELEQRLLSGFPVGSPISRELSRVSEGESDSELIKPTPLMSRAQTLLSEQNLNSIPPHQRCKRRIHMLLLRGAQAFEAHVQEVDVPCDDTISRLASVVSSGAAAAGGGGGSRGAGGETVLHEGSRLDLVQRGKSRPALVPKKPARNDNENDKEDQPPSAANIMQTEERATGSGFRWFNLKNYMASAGWGLAILCICSINIERVFMTGESVWLKAWTGALAKEREDATTSTKPLHFWLLIYLGIIFMGFVWVCITRFRFSDATTYAAGNMFAKMLRSVARAPLHWYEDRIQVLFGGVSFEEKNAPSAPSLQSL